MRCPKCGYHSFDHLESCKKCGGGLAVHRRRFGLGSFFPPGRDGAAAGKKPPSDGEGAEDVADAATDLCALPPEGAPAEGSSSALFDSPAVTPLPEAAEVLALDDDELFAFSPAVEEGSFPSAGSAHLLEAERGSGFPAAEEASRLDAGEGGREAQPAGLAVGDDELSESFPDASPGDAEAAALALLHRHALPTEEGESPAVERARLATVERNGEGRGVLSPIPRRLAAAIVDLLLLSLLCAAFWLAGGLALSADGAGEPLFDPSSLLEFAIPYFLLFFFVTFGYFTLFHYLTGQTPGKMLLRLRVEGKDGAPLLFSQAFLRSVGGLLSLLVAGAGFWRIFFDGERRGWNDHLAGSRVVPADFPEGDGELAGGGAEMDTVETP